MSVSVFGFSFNWDTRVLWGMHMLYNHLRTESLKRNFTFEEFQGSQFLWIDTLMHIIIQKACLPFHCFVKIGILLWCWIFPLSSSFAVSICFERRDEGNFKVILNEQQLLYRASKKWRYRLFALWTLSKVTLTISPASEFNLAIAGEDWKP